MKDRPYCAVSTPFGMGGVAIVRMSGKHSLEIAKQLFDAKNLDFENVKPRYMYLGNFSHNVFQDKCLFVFFKSPSSYTGEDVVEFQIHGGVKLAQKVLSACISCGARLAEPGEFTKNAFLNGKISLDKAEGVIDAINAESDAELRACNALASGTFCSKIQEFQKVMTDLIAEMLVALDYPEHDIEFDTLSQTKEKLKQTKSKIESIIQNSKHGSIVKNGINVCIVGKPNVGKSSILNAVLGQDRAIVSEIAGTTRDTICETITHDGIKINFVDTAGLHESKDKIEKIGMERTKQEIQKADIIMFVVDSDEMLTEDEKEQLETIRNKNYLIIINKIDKNSQKNQKNLIYFENYLENKKYKKDDVQKISAKNQKNIDLLLNKILKKTQTNNIDFSNFVLTNQRHVSALENANKKIEQAIEACDSQTLDIVCQIVNSAWNELGKITGETENENIVDAIFEKFCLGK